jgi:hypothetical protein
MNEQEMVETLQKAIQRITDNDLDGAINLIEDVIMDVQASYLEKVKKYGRGE